MALHIWSPCFRTVSIMVCICVFLIWDNWDSRCDGDFSPEKELAPNCLPIPSSSGPKMSCILGMELLTAARPESQPKAKLPYGATTLGWSRAKEKGASWRTRGGRILAGTTLALGNPVKLLWSCVRTGRVKYSRVPR